MKHHTNRASAHKKKTNLKLLKTLLRIHFTVLKFNSKNKWINLGRNKTKQILHFVLPSSIPCTVDSYLKAKSDRLKKHANSRRNIHFGFTHIHRCLLALLQLPQEPVNSVHSQSCEKKSQALLLGLDLNPRPLQFN